MVREKLVAIAGVLLLGPGVPARPAALQVGDDAGAIGSVPLHMTADALPLVDVMVNASGPYRFLLDTGSNRSAVSTRVAVALRLPAVARTAVVTAGGTTSATVVRLPSVAFGRITRQAVLATAIDTPHGLDGLIGQDVLMTEPYTLDYARQRLVWTPGQTGGAALPLKEADGRWLVGLQQHAGGPPLWFVPDSGASTLTLFDHGTPLALGASRLDAGASLATMNAELSVSMARIDRLDVGPIALRNQRAVVAERREADAPEGDGLLPLSRFASVTFDPFSRSLRVRER